MSLFDVIAFDADDTLWHEERKFVDAEQRVVDLLSRYHSADTIRKGLQGYDVANLQFWGYGVKSYVLSMIEAAIELTEGRVTGAEIQKLIDLGRDMLAHPIETFPHVETTLANVSQRYTVLLITKGDLLDQEMKLARSGLGNYFDHVEVVSNKRPESYRRVLHRYNIAPERFMMIGNALRSDIKPVIEIGGNAVYIPAGLSWAHEAAELDKSKFAQLDHIGQIPTYLKQLEG